MRKKLTFEEYLAHPAVSSSSLRMLLDRTPAHYKWSLENPSAPSPSQRFGTMVHEAILEPKNFLKNAVVAPKFEGTGSRKAKEEWYLENHGKLILSRDEIDEVHAILNSITKHPEAYKYLSSGRSEESGFWTDPDTGIECKYRTDFYHDKNMLVDVKTTRSAKYQDFQHSVASYGYHIQAAMHLDGAKATTGVDFTEFTIVAIENASPYEIGL